MIVSPEDYKLDVVPERPIGTEGEHTIWNVDGEGKGVSLDSYIDAAAVAAAGTKRVGNFIAETGSKLHIDVGKIEYTSPECLGPAEAAAYDQHGIELLRRVVTASNQPHKGLYRVAGTFLEREGRYDSRVGATIGFHHNYLAPGFVTDDMELLVGALGAHLSTRMWAWGGALRPEGFVLAQKMWGIGSPVGLGYTREGTNRTTDGRKPMTAILRGDDTLGNDEWVRIEDRSVDPALSMEVTELTLATTSLALRIVEHADKIGGRDRILKALELKDHVKAGHQFAGDLTLKQTVETTDCEQVTALDIQERLARLAIELSEKILLPEDESKAASKWLDLVRAMRASNPEAGEYTADALEDANFPMHHVYLLNKCKFKPDELHVRNARAAERSLKWGMILPEGPGLQYYRKVAERKGRAWPVQPPIPRTRAALRQVELANPTASYASWTYVTTSDGRADMVEPSYQPDVELKQAA